MAELAELDELRAGVRAFLRDASQEGREPTSGSPAADRDSAWTRSARELGLQGIAIPESLGGSGAGPVELGVVFEEMGAVLFSGPFLATVAFVATALLELADPAVSSVYLPGIADGSVVAALAWGGPDPLESSLNLSHSAGRWRVSGTAEFVVDGCTADLILVAATTPAGLALATVDGTAVRRTAMEVLDQTRPMAKLNFDDSPATLICATDRAAEVMGSAFDLSMLYLAAEQLGGAERILADCISYSKTRVQFGRPIGSFQVIKHRCADLFIEVEMARSAVEEGLRVAATGNRQELKVASLLARAVVTEAYVRIASEGIQLHGGLGFTWEHSSHRYLKRAKSSQLAFAAPSDCRRQLATLSGLNTSTEPRSPSNVKDPETANSNDEDSACTVLVADFLRASPVPPAGDDAADRAFREARFDAGLAVVRFDRKSGGYSGDSAHQSHIESAFAEAGAADHLARNIIGLGMAMPTIYEHGTESQRSRYLRPCFSGEEIWCQLFSEPGAGSDLASLATRAVRDGEDFLVTGQKVWTSLGHLASWGLLLARTDPDVPKHQGLTYFLLDMRAPGVEVRPLRQLTGDSEFNEVFLTNVRVPIGQVLGDIGDGWSVARTTLSNERVTLGSRRTQRGDGPIGLAVKKYREAALAGRLPVAAAEALMLLWTRSEVARLTNARAGAAPDRVPGPEGSAAKLVTAELNKAIFEFCVDLEGRAALSFDYDRSANAAGIDEPGTTWAYLRSLANSIEGGTSEILRTVLAERVLGMPQEPAPERKLPWKDIRRS